MSQRYERRGSSTCATFDESRATLDTQASILVVHRPIVLLHYSLLQQLEQIFFSHVDVGVGRRYCDND